MSDPRRKKDQTEVLIKAIMEDSENPVNFYLLADREKVKSLPKEEMERMIMEEFQKISPKPVSAIQKNYIMYSYSDADALSEFDFGNTLVQAHLPYCLHIPNFYEMKVSIPELNLNALVTFEKIWTNRAETKEAQSELTDLYAEDRMLYFKKSTMLTPVIPFKPKEGWDSHFTGTNIERMSDRNGTFRFTRLHIQFNSNYVEEQKLFDTDGETSALEDVKMKSLAIVNRIIDNYRNSTNEIHVRRLGDLKINLIYFIPQNQGCYMLLPNIETAPMNRSRVEIEEISKALESGTKPDIYKLLLLDARSSFNTGDYTLAIVESFQALEIFLENYLVDEYKKKGVSETEYQRTLKTNWQTKDRLNIVLAELKNTSLNKQGAIWDKWCTRYDKTRNEVLHKGKDATKKETDETLNANQNVIDWILSL